MTHEYADTLMKSLREAINEEHKVRAVDIWKELERCLKVLKRQEMEAVNLVTYCQEAHELGDKTDDKFWSGVNDWITKRLDL